MIPSARKNAEQQPSHPLLLKLAHDTGTWEDSLRVSYKVKYISEV
jgi:hypothetical protein